jgi:hypothetical protein
VSWREHAPEPARLWIRWSPRRWPAPPRPALDLAGRRRLIWPATAAAAVTGGLDAHARTPPRPDLVCLPPVPPELVAARESLVRELGEAGVPVVAQVHAGPGAWGTAAPIVALDLVASILAPAPLGLGELRSLAALPRAAARLWVVVPLVPGLPAFGGEAAAWFDALAALRPEAVVGSVPQLAPTDRRSLAEASPEELYEAIFHAEAASGRDFARRVAAAGLPAFPSRPATPAASPRTARNRELAATLAEAGELWLGLGRAEPEGEALLAAARHLESTPLDLAALAREANLGVVDWLSPVARRLVEERAGGGESTTLAALRAEWLAPAPGATA